MNISVIIPTHNRAHTLQRAIDSVIEQNTPVSEILLIDDGSSDGTGDLIQDLYPDIKYIYQPQHGVSNARNKGIEMARGEWIAFLDSDDSWLPHKISRVADLIQTDSTCQLIHSDEIWIRNGIRVNAMKKHQKRGGDIFEHCLPLCVISPSAVVVRKHLFTDFGLFDEDLPVCEDYDLWLRICSQIPVSYIDEFLITKYGGHEDQLSRQLWGMDRYRIISIHNLIKKGSLNKKQLAIAIKTLTKKLEILLKGARKHQNTQIIDEFLPLLNEWNPTSNLAC